VGTLEGVFTMLKWTDQTVECPRCGKRHYFEVQLIKQNEKVFYLTRCPRCKAYDDIKELTPDELKKFKLAFKEPV